MLGKFVSKKPAHIHKGKGQKQEGKRKKDNVLQKGVDGQTLKKNMEFWKRRQKENKEKSRIGRREGFKDRPFGKKEGNTSEITEPKHQKQKNTFLHVGKQPHIFGNFCLFSTCTLLFLQGRVLLKTL